jgi:hypothetical protein
MSDTETPAGFVPIFPGWNAWAVLQKDDLDFEALMVGVPHDRRLRIWVEEQADEAPGAAVGDPANPLALKGSQVEIIPGVEGLEVEADVAEVKPGQVPLWTDEPTSRRFVRFYNRGEQAFTPWPSDSNYFLATVFTPDPDNPITGSPAPGSLAGTVAQAASGAGTALKVGAALAGAALLVLLAVKLANSSRAMRQAA